MKYAFVLSSLLALASAGPVVNLGYASYEGTTDSRGYNIFYGIKYAAAPTGNFRWRAPQPPTSVPGIVDASTQTPTVCPQGTIAQVLDPAAQLAIPTSEDCLDLNVYAPSTATQTSNLPVVVHIHGGGYGIGSHNSLHDQIWLDLANNDVVAVAINYRLGLFGFLAGSEIKQGGKLNAGLLDQEYALKWVQQHIHKFGGDPAKVTLWGNSAGAGSIMHHAIAKNGNVSPRLFKQGIATSVYLPPQYDYDEQVPQNLYSQVVAAAGCSSAANTLACLRSAPFSVLKQANVDIAAAGGFGTFTWQPVTDGEYVTRRPSKALPALHGASLNAEKVIVMHQANEGFLFTPQGITFQNMIPFLNSLLPHLDLSYINQIVSMYNGTAATAFEITSQIVADFLFVCPSYRFADAFPYGKSWKATFAAPPAIHGQDNAYYYGVQPTPSQSMFENLTGSFLRFAQFGDPNMNRWNPTTNIFWKSWNGAFYRGWEKIYGMQGTDSSTTELEFSTAHTALRCLSVTPAPSGADEARRITDMCSFWHSIADLTRQ